jgi:hypothetical protein
VSEPLERARKIFASFEKQLKLELPAGAPTSSTRTPHLGHDIDGMVGDGRTTSRLIHIADILAVTSSA